MAFRFVSVHLWACHEAVVLCVSEITSDSSLFPETERDERELMDRIPKKNGW